MTVPETMRAGVLTGHGGLGVVGGGMFMPLVNALRQGGRYSSSGSIAGPLVEQDLLKPLLAQSFALRDLDQALETFMLKKYIGNIVVET